MRIDKAQPDTPIIDQVISLGDRNAHSLGHFPRAAFKREAGKGRIIVALSDDNRVVGYLLYRVARGRAVVQHLCVDEGNRRAGVARMMVDALKQSTKNLISIECHCAKEFENALKAWLRLGFIHVGEKPGRGFNQRPLIRLAYDHGHSHLFSSHEDVLAESTTVAALDLNVALQLLDHQHECEDPELAALRSDWLQGEVSFWTTPESHNELLRQTSDTERERRRLQLQSIPAVRHNHAEELRVYSELLSIMGTLHVHKMLQTAASLHRR